MGTSDLKQFFCIIDERTETQKGFLGPSKATQLISKTVEIRNSESWLLKIPKRDPTSLLTIELKSPREHFMFTSSCSSEDKTKEQLRNFHLTIFLTLPFGELSQKDAYITSSETIEKTNKQQPKPNFLAPSIICAMYQRAKITLPNRQSRHQVMMLPADEKDGLNCQSLMSPLI